MAQRNYGGVYANMDFDAIYGPKQYQEYPKHITTGPAGKYIVVKSADEERLLLAKMQQDEADAPAEQAPYVADPEKEILISRARELNIPFNSKWSKSKLKQTVEAAEFAVDILPPEETSKVRVSRPLMMTEIPSAETLVTKTEDEIKDELIAEAKELGIPANRLWGIPRLKAFIAETKAKRKA